MLVVLSEIECLDLLHRNAVYPDEFFTDFNEFTERYSGYLDATFVTILAGNCRFSKQKCIELFKILQRQADDKNNIGVREFYIVSDSELAVPQYYMYDTIPTSFTFVKKLSKTPNADLFSLLRGKESSPDGTCNMHLSYFDRNDLSKVHDRIEKTTDIDAELLGLIQRPSVAQMLDEYNSKENVAVNG